MTGLVRTAGAFSDRVCRFLERVEYVRARTTAQEELILKLRYEANLKEGTILPNESGILIDAFDRVPNAMNFAIYVDGELASSLRLHLISTAHPDSPAHEAFPEIIDPLLAVGSLIVDPNRLSADYTRARAFPELPYVTLRLAHMLARHAGAQYVTCTVRAEHQAFYKREFFAKTVCPPRYYPTIVKPIGLMLADFVRDGDGVVARHGFYASTATERKALFDIESAARGGGLASVA
jgi:hypothetical protein